MWKVMLADDEPYVREGMEKLIPWKELGCELVFQAKNGRELIERMDEERPDIVIVDIKMPVMGGLEVAQYLEEKGWTTKVIILTAYADFEYARQAIRFQVTDYCIKTMALDEIPKILEKTVRLLQERKLTSYQMILIYGLVRKGSAFSKIIDFCFDQETVYGQSSEGDCLCVTLCNPPLIDELFKRCRKLVEMSENFMGEVPVVCISCAYYEEDEAADIYGRAYEYILEHVEETKQRVWFAGYEEDEGKAGAVSDQSGTAPEEEALSGEETANLVDRTRRLIEKQFCNRLTLEEIADQVHANRSYLSRVYKQKTGENLFDVINRMRIERAETLMKEQKYKIYEIAELVGFEDTAYFSRVFKKFKGMSPKEYDRNCQSETDGGKKS